MSSAVPCPPEIDGPLLLPRQRHCDQRGWFEVIDDPELNSGFGRDGIDWQQWNISHSRRGVLRGLHYQSPHPQAKLIRVIAGSVWDVVVDLRKGSPTKGQWRAYDLSADTPETLYIPMGFAHGFLTTSAEATMVYAVSKPRVESSEEVIRWDDSDLAITWPGCEGGFSPILSERDAVAEPWLGRSADEI